MLLAKTLSSSTFKLALIAIGTFGVIMAAIFLYVYVSTVSYVRGRSDRAILTDHAALRDAYQKSGRDGLNEIIRQHMAYKGSADPWVVVGGSLGMAAFVCVAAGLLGRLGLRMRL